MAQQHQPLRVSKAELLSRLASRSEARYGGAITEVWLNDLVKDGLLDELDRGPNKGRSPQYFASKNHYRRALQLKRLYHLGIRSRDALRLQLFVRGYGVRPEMIGDALRNEIVKLATKLSPKLRSAYFNNYRDIPPAHMRSAARQTGVLDQRLEAFGLRQPPDFYVKTIRKIWWSSEHEGILSGLLLFDRELKKFPDAIENIVHASPTEFCHAREAFVLIHARFFRPLLGNALLDGPEWVALLLMIFLQLKRGGFTLDQVLDSIPNADGFLALTKDFIDEFGAGQNI